MELMSLKHWCTCSGWALLWTKKLQIQSVNTFKRSAVMKNPLKLEELEKHHENNQFDQIYQECVSLSKNYLWMID